ncbi:MAG: hypothetical protein RI897_1023 [Verrucomicrobiota bacterium]
MPSATMWMIRFGFPRLELEPANTAPPKNGNAAELPKPARLKKERLEIDMQSKVPTAKDPVK